MNTKEELLALKNKEFIFECLEILKSTSSTDYVSVLINPDECKRRFDINYAILQEVLTSGSVPMEYVIDSLGYRRYYPDTVSVSGRRFIVCNDWYYNTKVNKRDTRTDFVNWVLRGIR